MNPLRRLPPPTHHSPASPVLISADSLCHQSSSIAEMNQNLRVWFRQFPWFSVSTFTNHRRKSTRWSTNLAIWIWMWRNWMSTSNWLWFGVFGLLSRCSDSQILGLQNWRGVGGDQQRVGTRKSQTGHTRFGMSSCHWWNDCEKGWSRQQKTTRTHSKTCRGIPAKLWTMGATASPPSFRTKQKMNVYSTPNSFSKKASRKMLEVMAHDFPNTWRKRQRVIWWPHRPLSPPTLIWFSCRWINIQTIFRSFLQKRARYFLCWRRVIVAARENQFRHRLSICLSLHACS